MAKIMYIEDDVKIRDVGKLLLERKKHSVMSIENTDKAIAIASIWKPDIIITDHDLGTEKTGLMFAEKAKQQGFNVAMMTGSDVKEESESLGIPFFSKPCLITDVLEELGVKP